MAKTGGPLNTGGDTFEISSSLWENLFQHSLCSVAILDRHFNFVRVNRAYANADKLEPGEFIGRNHFDLYPSDAKPLFEQVVQSRQPLVCRARAFEYASQPEKGVTYWDWSLVPVLDEQGDTAFLFLVLNDVTEHKRTEQKLQDALDRLRTLSQRLVNIEEAQRHRIARDLHDSIGQSLIGLRLLVSNLIKQSCGCNATQLGEVLATSTALISSVRDIALQLRPSMLDDLGLLSAVLALATWHRSHTGIEVRVHHDGADRRFPPEVETAAFRIIQEGLVNAARHSGAAIAKVELSADEDSLRLSIEDNGVGFEAAEEGRHGKGLGLLGMQERASLLNGTLEISSAVGAGTRIEAQLPYFGHSAESDKD